MFASLAVGVGTVLKPENARNAETNFYESFIRKMGSLRGKSRDISKVSRGSNPWLHIK